MDDGRVGLGVLGFGLLGVRHVMRVPGVLLVGVGAARANMQQLPD